MFYRIDDIYSMDDSPKFFKLAYRVFAYKGVMRQWAENEAYEAEKNKKQGRQPQTRVNGNKVEDSVVALAHNEDTSDLFEIG